MSTHPLLILTALLLSIFFLFVLPTFLVPKTGARIYSHPYDVHAAVRSAATNRNSFFIPPSTHRELGDMLEALGGFTIGVELGNGSVAKQVASSMIACTVLMYVRGPERRGVICEAMPDISSFLLPILNPRLLRFSTVGDRVRDTISLTLTEKKKRR